VTRFQFPASTPRPGLPPTFPSLKITTGENAAKAWSCMCFTGMALKYMAYPPYVKYSYWWIMYWCVTILKLQLWHNSSSINLGNLDSCTSLCKTADTSTRTKHNETLLLVCMEWNKKATTYNTPKTTACSRGCKSGNSPSASFENLILSNLTSSWSLKSWKNSLYIVMSWSALIQNYKVMLTNHVWCSRGQ